MPCALAAQALRASELYAVSFPSQALFRLCSRLPGFQQHALQGISHCRLCTLAQFRLSKGVATFVLSVASPGLKGFPKELPKEVEGVVAIVAEASPLQLEALPLQLAPS